jgi:hypothetical protein
LLTEILVIALCVGQAAEVETRLKALEEGMEALKKENEQLKQAHDDLKTEHEQTVEQVKSLLPLKGRFFGYLDFGAFYVQGNGSGIRPDVGHKYYPQYSDVPDSWVFMGDPLSTTINARGEPASVDSSRAITFDAIHNDGKFSFIANALNLGLFVGIGESFTLNASVDLIPRGRDVSKPGINLGDYIDVKLAYVDYTLPSDRAEMKLYAGKFDSVLGIEYRSMDSGDRLTVTPSLVCRYTCGRPVGLKFRGRFFDDLLIVAASITNGSNFVENFAFSDEIDVNFFKTGSVRIATKLPVAAALELGASASLGAQDWQPADNVLQWHFGVDAHFAWRDLEMWAEFVIGKAPGKDSADGTKCGDAPCLQYKAAYYLVGYRVLNWLMPYARVDWREAFHRDGVNFIYLSYPLRITGGLHFDINEHFVVKAEYTHIHELGFQPQFANDVVTSALVVRY